MLDGLQALLRTIPEIEIAAQTDGESRALALIAQLHPAIVLLDSSLAFREQLPALRQIKDEYPQTGCIVLVENVQQQSATREAGADIVLIKGFNIEMLRAAIHQILMKSGNSTN
jgi:DNA-binding NarL/FixJ family response regulator